MQEAKLYIQKEESVVQCKLCNHFCVIPEGQSGICLCRINEAGTLYNLLYGKPVSINIDPIEKKPLFHYLPGTLSYSLGTYGCNFTCLNCHNWVLSQENNVKEKLSKLKYISPEKIVEDALESDCRSISYTYNEPTIPFEYYLDIMKIAKKNKLKNIWVSNGYMSEAGLNAIIPYLDATNIDLKSFNSDIYQQYYGANLEPILSNLKKLHNEQVHLEITTLLIPGISNDPEMLADLTNFISNSLDPDIPWHINKFSAKISYKLQKNQDTREKDIQIAYEIGKQAGLNYIYVGNMPGDQKENTYCPNCGELCIRRFFNNVERFDRAGECPNCKQILGLT